ncbi:MAG: peptide ABC transporter substrate-binding protein [Lachnospiraceae bacterium]|nr:peptide ABC transporter substrate-binding protein [Lachnospiraceae bacterium]
MKKGFLQRTKKLTGLFALGLATSFALAACGSTGQSDAGSYSGSSSSGSAATNAGGGVDRIATVSEKVLNIRIDSEPSTLDPNNGLTDQYGVIYSLVYEPLCRLDENGEAKAALATDWTVSDDGLTYTFQIRDDNKWSNGAASTAADFEYAIKRIAKQESGTNWAQLVFDIKGVSAAYSGTASVDDIGIHAEGNTLTVELESAEAYFPRMLAFSPYTPVNQEYVESQNGAFGTDVVIGSGPYYVDSWSHDDVVVLKKNPYYWDVENTEFDTINVYVIGDANTATNMFLSNELDAVDITGTQVPSVEAAGYQIQAYDSGRSVYLRLNYTNKVLQNEKIRQALSSAIDRETLANNVLKDGSAAATGLVTNGIAGANGKSFREIAGNTLVYGYDESKAKDLFESGLAELGIEAKDITLNIIGKNTFSDTGTILAALQEEFQNTFGITVNVENVDKTTYSSRSNEGDFDILLVAWGADWNDATTFLTQFDNNRDGSKPDQYNNDEFDALFDKAYNDASADALTRAGYLVDAEKILLEEAGTIPIYFKGQYHVVSDRIEGLITQSVIPYEDFTQVKLK